MDLGWERVRAAAAPRPCFATAALCSAALLAAALAFQYLGGLAPCELCVWQRVPYVAVLGLGALGALLAPRLAPAHAVALAAACALLFFADAAIAGFHVGVEQGWWEGSESCSAAAAPAGDLEALRAAVFAAPAAFCDTVAWSLFGLSMAAWNGLAALALGAATAVAAAGWRRRNAVGA